MVARTTAASPRKRTKPAAEPRVDESAKPRSFSSPSGDIRLGSRVSIAPGTSLRADEGTPFYIGDDSIIQDGVVMHGLEKSRVVGDDGKEYSIWIGRGTCLTHLALVHGPAYVGDRCFIGFRSTVFNARVGADCIVMMHALIQDVEIAAGKFVPSGAVITSQQQADRLPDVTEADRAFARHIVAIGEAGATPTKPPRVVPSEPATKPTNETNYSNSVTPMSLNTNIRSQLRSLLSQGYKIGLEYADKRRFKTGSWLSAGFIEGTREDQVAASLEASLRELRGEYVRLIGVDASAKRRVLEMIVQRPEDVPGAPARTTTAVHTASHGNGKGGSDLSVQVRSLLAQGFKIGTEHADKRRFKTGSWLTGPSIESKSESSIVREIENLLIEHGDEYVRLIGIDPTAKKRVVEMIVQRPGEGYSPSSNGSSGYSAPSSNGKASSYGSSAGLSSATIAQIRSLLSQGYKIGTEHADKRRFKTGSWQSCAPIESNRESDVVAALEACLREHSGEYVRLLGIDSKAKKRVLEAVIQRPDGSIVINGNGGTKAAAPVSEPSFKSYSGSSYGGGTATVTSTLTSETIAQIRSLLNQGYKIGSEHADKRRFKTGSWQSCTPIDSPRENDVISALEACLRDHAGEYVRLIGIDSKAKKRVLETVIQRP